MYNKDCYFCDCRRGDLLMLLRQAHVLKVFVLFFVICIILGLSLLFSSSVTRAVSNPIQVNSQSSILTFPKAIDFKISVHDSGGSLARATVYLTYENSGYQPSHQVIATGSASAYTFQWHDNLLANIYEFPLVGTQISYYWTITDTTGNSYTSPSQTIEIVDNRFNWQHLSKGLYRVNWYGRGTDFGQMVLGKVGTDIQRISHNLGGGLNHLINLWVYQNTNDFQGSLPPNVHEWVGGIAFPSVFQGSIVAQSAGDDTLQRDMPHELTHLVFHQIVAPSVAPTWFDEGLAVDNQSYHESEMLVRFKTALNDHDLLPLKRISQDFPANADTAYLAYAQSWQLVAYMYQTFGLQKMIALIHDMGNPNQSFDADMRQALGLDVAHLENQWHLSLNQPPTLSKSELVEPLPAPQPPLNPYNSTTIFLLLLGIVLVAVSLLGLGAIFSYQRRAKQMVVLARQRQYTPQHTVSSQQGSPNWLSQQVNNYTSPSAYALPEQSLVLEQNAQRSEYPRFQSSPPSQRG
jgi:hypothetical protein